MLNNAWSLATSQRCGMYGAWVHHTNLIQCLSLPLPLIHPPPSIFKRGELCGGKGWMKCYIIFFSMWNFPPMWSASTSPFIHPKSTHYILVFIFPYLFIHRWCSNFNGGAEMQCSQVTTSGFKRRGHGWWHMMYDVHGHMRWDSSSSIPSLANYPYIHLQKGCHWTMEHVWNRIWASPTFQHTRSHKVHIQMRLTSRTSHPSSGWKPIQVGNYKEATLHICLCWVPSYRRRLFVLT